MWSSSMCGGWLFFKKDSDYSKNTACTYRKHMHVYNNNLYWLKKKTANFAINGKDKKRIDT